MMPISPLGVVPLSISFSAVIYSPDQMVGEPTKTYPFPPASITLTETLTKLYLLALYLSYLRIQRLSTQEYSGVIHIFFQ